MNSENSYTNPSLQTKLMIMAKSNSNLVETTLYFVGIDAEHAKMNPEFDSWEEADSYCKDQEEEHFIYCAKAFINFNTLSKV